MKAIVYKEKNKIELQNIAKPELINNGAIIKVKGCGLCGSDIVKLKQGLFKPNAVLGHEVVGIIYEIKGNGDFNVGDRVVLGHHVPCFNCVFCKNKNFSMCEQFKKTNIIPGGFAEYIYVSENHLKNTIFKVPEHIPDAHAAFTEPVSCCLRAVKRADVKENDIVFIIGLGSIGLLMGQVLKNAGAKVIGCDLIDERIQIARELGFDAVYKYTNNKEISELIKSNFQKEGADKIFLTSGHAGSIDFALSSVRNGGTILVFASVPSENAGFANNQVYYRELTVLGSYSPSPDDLRESLDLIKNNKIKTDRLFTVYTMDEVEKAIEDTCSNKIIKAFVIINSNLG